MFSDSILFFNFKTVNEVITLLTCNNLNYYQLLFGLLGLNASETARVISRRLATFEKTRRSRHSYPDGNCGTGKWHPCAKATWATYVLHVFRLENPTGLEPWTLNSSLIPNPNPEQNVTVMPEAKGGGQVAFFPESASRSSWSYHSTQLYMAFSWRGCCLLTIPTVGRRSPLLRTRGYVILRGHRGGSVGSAFDSGPMCCRFESHPRNWTFRFSPQCSATG